MLHVGCLKAQACFIPCIHMFKCVRFLDQLTKSESPFCSILSPFLYLMVAKRSADRVPEPEFS